MNDSAIGASIDGRKTLACIDTNGFEIALPESVSAIVRDVPDPRDVSPERERLSGYWFVHWLGGKLYHLRLRAGGPNVDGQESAIATNQHPWLLRARLEDAISEVFHKYDPQKQRPFRFLAQNTADLCSKRTIKTATG